MTSRTGRGLADVGAGSAVQAGQRLLAALAGTCLGIAAVIAVMVALGMDAGLLRPACTAAAGAIAGSVGAAFATARARRIGPGRAPCG